jgi:hypothetical protein
MTGGGFGWLAYSHSILLPHPRDGGGGNIAILGRVDADGGVGTGPDWVHDAAREDGANGPDRVHHVVSHPYGA